MEHSVFYRRDLPHLSRADRPLFITMTTRGRQVLPPGARTLVLRHILAMQGIQYAIEVAVVMPDHAHLVVFIAREFSLAQVMRGIKGTSSRSINLLLGRRGAVWLPESFDHVMRSREWTRQKIEYICDNPVRAGLVDRADDYPWLWRAWREGDARGLLPPWVRP